MSIFQGFVSKKSCKSKKLSQLYYINSEIWPARPAWDIFFCFQLGLNSLPSLSSTQFQPAVKGKNNPAKIISPHCAWLYLMMRLVELQEVKYGTFMYFNERSSFDTLHYTHAFSDKLVGKF